MELNLKINLERIGISKHGRSIYSGLLLFSYPLTQTYNFLSKGLARLFLVLCNRHWEAELREGGVRRGAGRPASPGNTV